MTAAVTTSVLEDRTTSWVLPAPVALALQEGRRLVLHPLALAGVALFLLQVAVERGDGPRDAFETVTLGPTWIYGVMMLFAAHAVASRDRRADSGELLTPTPLPPSGRVAGLCLGALAPAVLALALVIAVHGDNRAADAYVVAPSGWHLVHGPLTVLGAALLGIMVARLTSVPGAPLLVMVVLFLGNAWLNARPETLQPLAMHVPWAVWTPNAAWAGLHPGSPAWHVGYLVALCAMAASGAFLREAGSRRRVLAVGACSTALAVVTGLAQLP